MIAIYVRVSTEEQLKGYSVEGQIDDCINLAGTKDVLKYVDDGYTGEILNRPQLTKLLEDVDQGLINKVICYDPDRLSRKLLNQLIITEKLDKNNIVLEFVQSDYKNDAEGQLYFQVRGAFSEFDKAKIKHNTMTGRYRKAKQGFVVKDNGLYGYDYDKQHQTYVINKREAQVVQLIFNYYTDPNSTFKGINGIAHHLTNIGVPTSRGGKVWHRQVVRQILLNESYTGIYFQNKHDTVGDYVKRQSGEAFETGRLRARSEWLETKIPRIITDEQFYYAQALLQQSRRRHTKHSKHNYLLSGLVRCGRCGETMTGRKRKSHGKDYYVYECRKNYAGAKSKGCGRQMSENKLNNYVWSTVVEFLTNIKEINSYKSKSRKTYIWDEVSHMEEQINQVRVGKRRLLTLVTMSEKDGMDLGEIKDKIKEMQKREQSLLVHLNEFKKDISNSDLEKTDPSQFLANAMTYYCTVKGNNLKKKEKKKILGIILKEVGVIDARTIHIYTF